MNKIKILYVGDSTYDMYVKALYNATLNITYVQAQLYETNKYIEKNGKIRGFRRFENHYSIGPHIMHMNMELIRRIETFEPHLVFFYSTRCITPKTILRIKQKDIKIFMYNNDNPFAVYYPKYFWRNYIKCLKYADIGYVYRTSNIEDYKRAGCKKVLILMSYYIKEKNYYISPEDNLYKDQMVPKVVFLGHYENDVRDECIKAILNEGIMVGVTERTWESFEINNSNLIRLKDTHKYYNEILNKSEIALVFLSSINNDTYTRRCFEIPATKTLMMAPYTKDIASMFNDGSEVVLYTNKEDLVKKVKLYLQDDERRNRISEGGFARVMKDGHEALDRVKKIIRDYEQLSW